MALAPARSEHERLTTLPRWGRRKLSGLRLHVWGERNMGPVSNGGASQLRLSLGSAVGKLAQQLTDLPSDRVVVARGAETRADPDSACPDVFKQPRQRFVVIRPHPFCTEPHRLRRRGAFGRSEHHAPDAHPHWLAERRRNLDHLPLGKHYRKSRSR